MNRKIKVLENMIRKIVKEETENQTEAFEIFKKNGIFNKEFFAKTEKDSNMILKVEVDLRKAGFKQQGELYHLHKYIKGNEEVWVRVLPNKFRSKLYLLDKRR